MHLLHCLAAACLAAACARATDCRLTLADQSDWYGKLGFYVNLENTAPGTQPCQLGTMTLALGVADGTMWRFSVQRPAWQVDRDYTIKAVVRQGLYEFWLDGRLLERKTGNFAPFKPLLNADLQAGFVPGWAGGATNYLVTQTALTIQSSAGKTVALDFSDTQRPPALMLMAPGMPKRAKWSANPADNWTITATIHIGAAPNPRVWDPHIDRYGQSRYAEWPGKIRSDADLTQAATAETAKLQEWGVPSGFDPYGGVLDAGWKEQATGFFRVVRRNVWWLVTPLGNPSFYIGLDTAPALNWDRTPVTGRMTMFAELPPRDPEFWGRDSWGQNDGTEDVCFNAVNMNRKYGDNWKAVATDLTVQRIKTWGFSGFGKWASDAGGLPILPVLSRGDVPSLVRHPDIFDAGIQARFRTSLANQVVPRKTDPLVVGWSLGNEYDEIITAQEVADMLKKGAAVPAKRALIDEAVANLYGGSVSRTAAAWGVTANTRDDLYAASPAPSAADLEHLRLFFAGAYYKFVYETVKALDSNHLYFGFWIVPGWWENENDWRVSAPYCDVIGYDRYNDAFLDAALDRLLRETGKPALVGEFGFPAHYTLTRGFRDYGVSAADDAASGTKYAKWLTDARRNPYCVGVGWFQYRDEPVSGRGPGQGPDLVYGEDFAFGMVDVGDRPKYDLVERVRTANLEAARARLGFQPPTVNAGGAVNPATFENGAPVAPGGLVSIFGTNLDGITMLRMGDYAVPLLWVGPYQINAQVPWELAGQSRVQLVASNGNVIEVPLATYAPGIFAAVPAAGGTKAKRGDYVTIYANGLGPVTTAPPTGAPGPDDPLATTLKTPSVSIGGVLSPEIQFSGLHPIWIGLYQVNAKVPADAPVGDAVLYLEIAGLKSNTVTIAIE